jgi:hypothetical protein
MSMTVCGECNEPLSSTAKACPNCGATPPKQSSKLPWIIGGCIALIVAEEQIRKPSEAGKAAAIAREVADPKLKASFAQAACLTFATRAMHDPDSAQMDRSLDFPITEEAHDIYRVLVTGRAKNGFGAVRKINVICQVKRDASGDWALSELRELK